MPWVQQYAPVGGVVASACLAAIPLIILFYMLAVRKAKGHVAAAAGLIGAAGSFAPGDTAKFVLLLAPLVLACGLSTVMSWRFYREESRK